MRAHAHDPVVRAQLHEVRRLAGGQLSDEEVVRRLMAWIDEDRKATPLKALQGMIWEAGYRRADFHGQVYAATAASTPAPVISTTLLPDSARASRAAGAGRNHARRGRGDQLRPSQVIALGIVHAEQGQ